MSVKYSYTVGIRVKVTVSGDGTTSLLVHRADESFHGDPNKLRVSWNSGLNGSDNAVAAVEQYLASQNADYGWGGDWIIAGADKNSWMAVRVPKD